MKQKNISFFACLVVTFATLFGTILSSDAANPDPEFFEENIESLQEEGIVVCVHAPGRYCSGPYTSHSGGIVLDFKPKDDGAGPKDNEADI